MKIFTCLSLLLAFQSSNLLFADAESQLDQSAFEIEAELPYRAFSKFDERVR